MILNDNNIILRAIEQKDGFLLKEMMNDPEIERMVLGWSFPVSEKNQTDWINNLKANEPRFIIEYNTEAIGLATITSLDYKNSTANLNIKLQNGDYKGKGIGTKTIQLLVEFCFEELNLNCLTANILDYNLPSQKLFEKCGFIKEAILRSRVYKKGKYHNVLVYSLLKSEYCNA